MCDENTDKAKEAKAQTLEGEGMVKNGGTQGKRKLISPEFSDGFISRCGKRV